jgi:hypothetical protein
MLPYLADWLLLFDEMLVQFDCQSATALGTDDGRRLPISVVKRNQRPARIHLIFGVSIINIIRHN